MAKTFYPTVTDGQPTVLCRVGYNRLLSMKEAVTVLHELMAAIEAGAQGAAEYKDIVGR